MLVYLSTVGDVLARSFRRLYGRICRPRSCARKQQPPPPPPPVSGVMGKAYRYDNHVETKGSGNFYAPSKESSCDDLGTRSTGSAILLDCGSEGLLHPTTSSTIALQVDYLLFYAFKGWKRTFLFFSSSFLFFPSFFYCELKLSKEFQRESWSVEAFVLSFFLVFFFYFFSLFRDLETFVIVTLLTGYLFPWISISL